MVVESVAILAVCLVLLLTFLRSKYPQSVWLVIPIMIIPGLYLLQVAFLRFLYKKHITVNFAMAMILIVLVALAISCAIIAFQGRKIRSKAGRRIYYFALIGYSAVLTWMYVFYYVDYLIS